MKKKPFVSIVMLTHNAPKYVKLTINTLIKYTKDIDYELIVFDNKSEIKTRKILSKLYNKNSKISKLVFSKENHLFAKGNNLASKLCDEKANYILLMNSDIEVRDEKWLSSLVKYHKKTGKGISAYGFCEGNPISRADGFCLLIDRELYDKHQLDEDFQWWWSVTKLESKVLKDGYQVTAIKNYDEYLYHFGGKSGTDFSAAKGMDIESEKVVKWFSKKCVKEVDDIYDV